MGANLKENPNKFVGWLQKWESVTLKFGASILNPLMPGGNKKVTHT